jgi:Leu/Phe-tRNA-protein transferase
VQPRHLSIGGPGAAIGTMTVYVERARERESERARARARKMARAKEMARARARARERELGRAERVRKIVRLCAVAVRLKDGTGVHADLLSIYTRFFRCGAAKRWHRCAR